MAEWFHGRAAVFASRLAPTSGLRTVGVSLLTKAFPQIRRVKSLFILLTGRRISLWQNAFHGRAAVFASRLAPTSDLRTVGVSLLTKAFPQIRRVKSLSILLTGGRISLWQNGFHGRAAVFASRLAPTGPHFTRRLLSLQSGRKAAASGHALPLFWQCCRRSPPQSLEWRRCKSWHGACSDHPM